MTKNIMLPKYRLDISSPGCKKVELPPGKVADTIIVMSI